MRYPDPELERSILRNAASDPKKIRQVESTSRLIEFLSSLALHCFVNEYLLPETDEETLLIQELKETTLAELFKKAEPTESLFAATNHKTYRPLHKYDWCVHLKFNKNYFKYQDVIDRRTIAREGNYKNDTGSKKVSDSVSIEVRQQYEENPYPR